MSYLGDDVPTLPWSRHDLYEADLAEKTVVTEVPWFLEQELAALKPHADRPVPSSHRSEVATRLTPYAARPGRPNNPAPEPTPATTEPEPDSLVLTFTVGDDPLDSDNNSAAVIPLRADSFRAAETRILPRRSFWARARRRLFGLACMTWGLITRTMVLNRA